MAMTTASLTTPANELDLVGLATVAGIRLRRWRGLDVDLPAMWAASDAARVADGEHDRTSLEGMTTYYRHLERYDPERDLVIAETERDGVLAGYARVEWNDSNDGERWYEGVCIVDPAFRRRGLGSLLLEWSERRRLELAREVEGGSSPTDAPRALTTFIFDGDAGGATLLAGAGYRPFRRFASMQRPDLEEIPDVPLPDGIDVRPATRDRDLLRRVFEADTEAFRDHFGWTEGSDEKFAEFVESPDTDPDLWIVAWDGDEIAGAVLNVIYHEENAELGMRRGFLDSVYTRRPWRGRGLARALIMRSLPLLAERGMDTAALGVDADNPSGALGLYESCGFVVTERGAAWHRQLEGVR
jgi:mycothiol synthase